MKKVKVKAIIEYEIEVPDFYTKEDVEFQRNDGTWCASNMLQELTKLIKEEDCICQRVKYEYIGESDHE